MLSRRGERRSARVEQGGYTLVEFLMATGIGLFVIASASMAMADLVRSAGRAWLVTRVDQDLRIAADLIVGELRRAGHWQQAGRAFGAQGGTGGTGPGSVTAPRRNPYQAIILGPAGDVFYSQSLDAEDDVVGSHESFGLRLQASAIQHRLGGSGWQSVTDASVVAVTRLDIVPFESRIELSSACPAACSNGTPTGSTPSCPTQTLRRYDVRLQAHAVGDPSIVREMQLSVRNRNDALEGSC